jgi:hypothetical protein
VIAPGDKPLAEYRATALDPPDGMPRRAFNAVLPILTVIGVTLYGLYSPAARAGRRRRGAGNRLLGVVARGGRRLGQPDDAAVGEPRRRRRRPPPAARCSG